MTTPATQQNLHGIGAGAGPFRPGRSNSSRRRYVRSPLPPDTHSRKASWVGPLTGAVFAVSAALGATWLAIDYDRPVAGTLLAFGCAVAVKRVVMDMFGSDSGKRIAGSGKRMLESKRQSGTVALTTSGVVLGLIALNGVGANHSFQIAATALAATIALAFVHLDVVAGMSISEGPGPVSQDVELGLLQTMQMTFLFGLISVVAGILSTSSAK